MGFTPFGQLRRDAPGHGGSIAAFFAEMVIAFILMTVILHVSNNSRFHKLTGVCAGLLVAAYITVEAPLSGMSMKPGSHTCLSGSGTPLERLVDLFHCTAHWHVVGGRDISSH